MQLFGLLLLLCCTALYVKCDEITKEKAKAAAADCKAETGATDADVEAMLKHKPAESSESKCLRACVMKKFEILDSDGKLNKVAAIDLVKALADGNAKREELGTEVVETCEQIEVPDDICEAAEVYGACMKKAAEEKGLLGELEV